MSEITKAVAIFADPTALKAAGFELNAHGFGFYCFLLRL